MLVQYAFQRLLVHLCLVKTTDMVADIFTKAVDEHTFTKMRGELHNNNRMAQSNGKVNRLIDALAKALITVSYPYDSYLIVPMHISPYYRVRPSTLV